MRVILSYGMGVESTAILLRWLDEPDSRDFPLSDLTVVTAMVGDEYPSTARDVAAHILPRLKAAGVRFVQVARAGASTGDGTKILDDSRAPEALHIGGGFRLSDEMKDAATIPTTGCKRLCSVNFKGAPIDGFLGSDLGDGEQYRHALGFNSDEMDRVAKDNYYGGNHEGRKGEFPLVDWGWNRDRCVDYIRERTGAEWGKSCCTFCPYTRGEPWVMERYKSEPAAAAHALAIERTARAFNPLMVLYGTKSLEDKLRAAGNTEAIRLADEAEKARPWAVFRMRRAISEATPEQVEKRDVTKREKRAAKAKIRGVDPATLKPVKPKKGQVDRGPGMIMRSITRLTKAGTKAQMLARLAMMAAEHGVKVDGDRAEIHHSGPGNPRYEEALVVAPIETAEKHGRWGLDAFDAHARAVLDDLAKRPEHRGGPWIGPRGGKWADPEHKQHWELLPVKAPKPAQPDRGQMIMFARVGRDLALVVRKPERSA